jgi:hypothetical protein
MFHNKNIKKESGKYSFLFIKKIDLKTKTIVKVKPT